MDYNDCVNKPSINGIELVGNKTAAELGLADASELEKYITKKQLADAGYKTQADLETLLNTELSEIEKALDKINGEVI